jgi:hypothetical protein
MFTPEHALLVAQQLSKKVERLFQVTADFVSVGGPHGEVAGICR